MEPYIIKKIFYLSFSSEEQAKTDGVPNEWYTLADYPFFSKKLLTINPWNHDVMPLDESPSIYELVDSCVVTIRPAKSTSPLSLKPVYHDKSYFIELSNQDGSISVSSRRIYNWEQAIESVDLFKYLSFDDGLKLWELKKL